MEYRGLFAKRVLIARILQSHVAACIGFGLSPGPMPLYAGGAIYSVSCDQTGMIPKSPEEEFVS
jgi:hypothetical protein